MEEMLYADDLIWNDPDRHAFDPRRIAWIEVANSNALARYCRGGQAAAKEAVEVRRVSPQRVELDVALESPGFVILADSFYPGWTLTVDDRPTPILRANRMMRGRRPRGGSPPARVRIPAALLRDRQGRQPRRPPRAHRMPRLVLPRAAAIGE